MLVDDYKARVTQSEAAMLRRRVRSEKRLERLRRFHAIFGPKRTHPDVGNAFVEIAYCATLPMLRADAHAAVAALAPDLSPTHARHLLAMTQLAVADRNRPVADLATDADWEAWIASL